MVSAVFRVAGFMLNAPVCSVDSMAKTTPDFTSEWCRGHGACEAPAVRRGLSVPPTQKYSPRSGAAIVQTRVAIVRGRTMASATTPAKVPMTTVYATQATSCGNNASQRYLGTGGMLN